MQSSREKGQTAFLSFRDRRSLPNTLSTPQRHNRTTLTTTPTDPTLSSIASIRYGATPSAYEDPLEDWMGGGGGRGSAVRDASRAAESLSRSVGGSRRLPLSVSPNRARSATRSPPRQSDHHRAPLEALGARQSASPTTSVSRDDAAVHSPSRVAPQPVPSPRKQDVRVVSFNTKQTPVTRPQRSRREVELSATRGGLTPSDKRLAQRDRQLRHTDMSELLPDSAVASLSPARSSLQLALEAHWKSVESLLDATAPLNGRGASLVGTEAEQVRARIERDLLATLARMPGKATMAVEEAHGVVPLLLAFSIAPAPTVRTQAIALAALKAVLVSLPERIGLAGTDQFIADVVLGQHHGLEALDMAFVSAVQATEKSHTAVVQTSPRQLDGRRDVTAVRQTELTVANTLMLNVLELLASLATLSPTFTQACIGTLESHLVQRVVQFLPAAHTAAHLDVYSSSSTAVTQDMAIGLFLLSLCQQHNAGSDVVVAYGGHRLVLDHLRVLFRFTSQTARADQFNSAVVQTLAVYLRLLTRLVRGCSDGLRHLYAEPAVAAVLKAGLTSSWGPHVEISGLLLVSLLQAHPGANCGGALAHIILEDASIVSVLSGLLVSRQSTQYALTAALAWRWLVLVAPEACGRLLNEDGGLLPALLEVLMYHTMPSHEAGTVEGKETTAERNLQLLLVETTLVLCSAVALGSLDARRALHKTLKRQLSDVTRLTLRERLETNIGSIADDYLASLPAVEVLPLTDSSQSQPVADAGPSSGRSSTGTATSATRVLYQTAEFARSSRASSATSADHASESDREMGTAAQSHSRSRSKGQPLVVNTASLWRRLLLHNVATLLPKSEAGGHAAHASVTARRADAQNHGLTRAGIAVAPMLLSPESHLAESAVPASEAPSTGVTDAKSSTSLSLSLLSQSTHTQQQPLKGGTRARVLGLDVLAYRAHPVSLRAQHVMGPRLVQNSIEVVLQLAQSYVDSSEVLPTASMPATQSTGKGVTSDRSAQVSKEANPWCPPTPTRLHQRRRWTIDALEQDDVLLFLIRSDHLVEDMTATIALVTDHMRHLYRTLQTCPQKSMTRRCVLTDLYRNVYPKIHLFLRYIDSQIGRSRSVLQLLATVDGGNLHSGNIIAVYDSVGVCVGDQLA